MYEKSEKSKWNEIAWLCFIIERIRFKSNLKSILNFSCKYYLISSYVVQWRTCMRSFKITGKIRKPSEKYVIQFFYLRGKLVLFRKHIPYGQLNSIIIEYNLLNQRAALLHTYQITGG